MNRHLGNHNACTKCFNNTPKCVNTTVQMLINLALVSPPLLQETTGKLLNLEQVQFWWVVIVVKPPPHTRKNTRQ